jgi:hypothetical protein
MDSEQKQHKDFFADEQTPHNNGRNSNNPNKPGNGKGESPQDPCFLAPARPPARPHARGPRCRRRSRGSGRGRAARRSLLSSPLLLCCYTTGASGERKQGSARSVNFCSYILLLFFSSSYFFCFLSMACTMQMRGECTCTTTPKFGEKSVANVFAPNDSFPMSVISSSRRGFVGLVWFVT